MSADQYDNSLKQLAVSRHEASHVACAAMLGFDLKGAFRTKGHKGGSQVTQPPVDYVNASTKTKLRWVKRQLMVLRAPLASGTLESEWASQDKKDCKTLVKAARDLGSTDILAKADAELRRMVNQPLFKAIQNAVARELEQTPVLYGAKLREIVEAVYPTAVTGVKVFDSAGQRGRLTEAGRKEIAKIAVKLGINPADITSVSTAPRDRKADPLPRTDATYEHELREAQRGIEEVKLHRDFEKRLDAPNTKASIVDQFDRETRAQIAIERGRQEKPKRYGPDGEELLG